MSSELPVPRAQVFAQLGRVLAGLFVGLLLVDVGVGRYDALRDLQDDELHVPDSELHWTNRPGFENEKTRINSDGLRSPEIPPDPPADEVRVLGVGASRIYGGGKGSPPMDETWSAELQRFCDASLPGHWRILNGGVMGYSAVQSSRRAIRLIPALRPDLVLVFVAPGSQVLLDLTAGKEWLRVEGELLPADLAAAWPEALWPVAVRLHQLLRHSSLYTRYRAQFQGGERDPTLSKWVLSREPLAPAAAELLGRTLDELATLRDVCAENGIELRVVVLPQAFQDSDRAWTRYLQRYQELGAPAIGTPRGEPTAALLELLRGRGLPTWDMTTEVEVIGSDRKRFTCDGAHWSAQGHAVIARGLAQRLLQADLASKLVAARRASPRG